MAGVRIDLLSNVLEINPRGSCRRLFTTKDNKERIGLAREDRKEKFEIRSLRRAMTYHFDELEKDKRIIRIQDFLLMELARQENSIQGLSGKPSSSLCKMENHNRTHRILAKIRSKTVKALRTLI
jgi:hypothetical protein